MGGITTHVLDTSRGRPAAGVPVVLEARGLEPGSMWGFLSQGVTDANGRLQDLLPEGAPLKGDNYRLVFDVGSYFAAAGVEAFYTEVVVSFVVRDHSAHYHVPLLLSPYGYSTYRGS